MTVSLTPFIPFVPVPHSFLLLTSHICKLFSSYYILIPFTLSFDLPLQVKTVPHSIILVYYLLCTFIFCPFVCTPFSFLLWVFLYSACPFLHFTFHIPVHYHTFITVDFSLSYLFHTIIAFSFFFLNSPHIPFLSVMCIFYFSIFYRWQNAACVCSVSWQWYWVCIKHDRNLISYVFNLCAYMNIVWFLSLAKLYIFSCRILSIVYICIELEYECYATMGHSDFVIFKVLPSVTPKCLRCVYGGTDTSRFCVKILHFVSSCILKIRGMKFGVMMF